MSCPGLRGNCVAANTMARVVKHQHAPAVARGMNGPKFNLAEIDRVAVVNFEIGCCPELLGVLRVLSHWDACATTHFIKGIDVVTMAVSLENIFRARPLAGGKNGLGGM